MKRKNTKVETNNGKENAFKNLQLLISAVVVFFIAIYYGLFTDKILPILFDFNVETVDLKNIFRSLMSLYLGMVTLWILGILKPKLWQTATIVNIVFMGSLALGRILSLLIDGIPSTCFLVGLMLEVLLVFWGVKNLTKYS